MARQEADNFIKGITVIRAGATDRQASLAPALYPTMKYDGSLIKVGTRMNHNGRVVKAAVDLWDNEDSNPDNAPNLWVTLNYINGIRIIPSVITVAERFSKDEPGYWEPEGKVYISNVDNNTYTPVEYKANWREGEA